MGKLIGGFIIIVFVYLVIKGIFGVIGSVLGSLGEFMFNSIWGAFALLAGILAILFFYASSKTYPDVRAKGRTMKLFKPMFKKLDDHYEYSSTTKPQTSRHMNSNIKKSDTGYFEVDMKTDVRGFMKNLAIAVNQPNPIFFKGWANRRFRADVERVQIMNDYIRETHRTFDSLLDFQADIIFSDEKIEHLLQVKEISNVHEIDILTEEFNAKKWDIGFKRKMDETTLKDREIDQKEREAHIEEQKTRVGFYAAALKDFPDLPAPIKAYMFTQVFGKNPDANRDFTMEDKIQEYMSKKYQSEMKQMDYEDMKKNEEAQTYAEKMKREREKYKGNE
jgi:hypothetical protein